MKGKFMNSVLHILYEQISKRAKDPCLHYLKNQHYESISFESVAFRSQQLSQWLNQHCKPNDKVVIWANNCWQWAVTDLACQLSGVVSIPIYATTGADDLSFIFNDSLPSVVFVDDALMH